MNDTSRLGTGEPVRVTTRVQLQQVAKYLGVRPDWHEPGEQEVTAEVYGEHLDNAGFWGEQRNTTQPGTEQWVLLKMGGQPVAEVNLATLLAMACGTTDGEHERGLDEAPATIADEEAARDDPPQPLELCDGQVRAPDAGRSGADVVVVPTDRYIIIRVVMEPGRDDARPRRYLDVEAMAGEPRVRIHADTLCRMSVTPVASNIVDVRTTKRGE
jgi:hypothetical protein